MGGVIVLNPDAVVESSGWSNVGGAATLAAALADASDATYATDTVAGSQGTSMRLSLTTGTLPDGAAIRYVTPFVRASQAAGTLGLEGYVVSDGLSIGYSYGSPQSAFIPSPTIQDFTLAAAGELNDLGNDGKRVQEVVDSLQLVIRIAGGGQVADDHRVYKARAEATYIDAPTASGVALVDPASTARTTKPPLKWTFSAELGMPQYAFRAAVWAVADINLYPGGRAAFEADPATIFGSEDGSTLFSSSGASFVGTDGQTKRAKSWNRDEAYGRYPGSWTVSSSAGWTPEHDLPGSGDYAVYIQVAAFYAGARLSRRLGAASHAKTDFTMNLTPPAAPTAVTAAWQYPAAAAPNNTDKYATTISVSYPAEATLNGFTGRRVQVEHRLAPSGSPADGDWRILPLGVKDAPGLGAGTLSFYDTMTVPGKPTEYRARVVFWDSSNELPSAWASAAGSVTPVFDQFVLRDPLDESGQMVLRLEGDLSWASSEELGQFRALGQERPTFASDAVTARVYPCRARLTGTAAADAFTALRLKRKTMLMQTDMDGQWAWVRFGPEVQETVRRAADRKTAQKREAVADFQLLETYPVAGQPATWR